MSRFFDDKADEDNEIDEGSDEDNERGARQVAKEDQYYTAAQLQRRNKFDVDDLEKRAKERVEHELEDDVDHLDRISEEYGEENYEDGRQLPQINDPKIWQVRVKRGQERTAVMSLMNKCIDYAKKGNHLTITSVTCVDKVEGFIYVEAFKEF